MEGRSRAGSPFSIAHFLTADNDTARKTLVFSALLGEFLGDTAFARNVSGLSLCPSCHLYRSEGCLPLRSPLLLVLAACWAVPAVLFASSRPVKRRSPLHVLPVASPSIPLLQPRTTWLGRDTF